MKPGIAAVEPPAVEKLSERFGPMPDDFKPATLKLQLRSSKIGSPLKSAVEAFVYVQFAGEIGEEAFVPALQCQSYFLGDIPF